MRSNKITGFIVGTTACEEHCSPPPGGLSTCGWLCSLEPIVLCSPKEKVEWGRNSYSGEVFPPGVPLNKPDTSRAPLRAGGVCGGYLPPHFPLQVRSGSRSQRRRPSPHHPGCSTAQPMATWAASCWWRVPLSQGWTPLHYPGSVPQGPDVCLQARSDVGGSLRRRYPHQGGPAGGGLPPSAVVVLRRRSRPKASSSVSVPGMFTA